MARLQYSIFAFFFIALSFFFAHGKVPPSQTFKYVNEGEFGEYLVEYGAAYRVLPVGTFPFQLAFYNTTPNAFTLALRMGHPRSESILRWIWDANRGKPVRENATLSFGEDGNLVLADSDGTIVWQTATANKGVVGLKITPTGNLVLYDGSGKFIWQSFDHPTDTILVGQTLRVTGPNRLVSRVSSVDGSEGAFSFVVEKNHWAMYMKSKNSQKPLLYFKSDDIAKWTSLLFYSEPETDEAFAFELGFKINTNLGASILARPKYNSTYSMLRVESDGNFKIYTYYDKVDYGAWETTIELFDRDNGRANRQECNQPTRCGSLGVCEDDQCVACPRPQGLLGWSKDCAPPVLPACRGGANVDYYKVVGVDHFLNRFNEGEGPVKVEECRAKCSRDCGCLGFFYREESSKCLLAPVLGTLIKVPNTSHVGYIKRAK